MIHAKQQDLKRSYKKHYMCYKELRQSNNHLPSRNLLLFYAVECGLKYLLLKDIGLNTTEALFENSKCRPIHNNKHDIRAMLKILGYEGLFSFKTLKTANHQNVEPYCYNQVWRYGIQVQDYLVETTVENTLSQIAAWLDEKSELR